MSSRPMCPNARRYGATTFWAKTRSTSNDVNQARVFDAMANNVFVTSTDEKKVGVGRVAVVEATYVAVQGTMAWWHSIPLDTARASCGSSPDVSSKASVFGDDQHVFVFDRDASPGRPKCQALRAQDGMPVKCGDSRSSTRKNYARSAGGFCSQTKMAGLYV